MLWNWLTQILRLKSKPSRGDCRVHPKPRRQLLELEVLESRVMPIVGAGPLLPPTVAPGGPFDGVVKITHPNPGGGTETGSGSLLFDNNHILTAAHVVSGLPDEPTTFNDQVTFNLARQNNAGVGNQVAPVNITLNVPANGGPNQFQTIHPAYVPLKGNPPPDLRNDLAILTLPDQQPGPNQATSRLVAVQHVLVQ